MEDTTGAAVVAAEGEVVDGQAEGRVIHRPALTAWTVQTSQKSFPVKNGQRWVPKGRPTSVGNETRETIGAVAAVVAVVAAVVETLDVPSKK